MPESYPTGPRPSTEKTTGKVGKTPATGAGPRPVVKYIDGWKNNIPADLLDFPQWVYWKFELSKSGLWTKVPYRVENPLRKASTTDPRTWAPFNDTIAEFQFQRDRLDPGRVDGLGFVFSKDDPFTGWDLDHCLDEKGQPLPWAIPYLEILGPHGDISPSGRGVKGIVVGTLPGPGNKKNGLGPDGGALELYSVARFFTITGNPLNGVPAPIEDRSAVVTRLHRELFPPKPKPAPKPARKATEALPGDDELIALAVKYNPAFGPLYVQGDTSRNHGDDSAADFALCTLLAYWFGRDEAAVDRVFRTSALMRDKWDERRGDSTYGAVTVGNAVAAQTKVYEPRSPKPAPPIGPQPSVNGDGHPANQVDNINLIEPSANGNGRPPIEPSVNGHAERPREPSLNERLAKRPRTDLGNAERLVARHGADLRYCHPWKKWLVWDGKRWKLDDTGGARRLARRTVRAIFKEAATIEDDEKRKAHGHWQLASETRDRLAACLCVAEAEEGIPILPDEIDRNPWVLNCVNGTLDLRTGHLRGHRREDLITKLCPVRYDGDADCPLWTATLDKVFAKNQNLIGFWQRLCGCVLTGTVTEQILPILHGTGANGKSTLLNVLLKMLGPDFAMKAMPDLLMVKRNETHPTDKADLFGMRLVVAIETGEGARINEALIKELTGSDRIRARRMREDPWEFEPSHKIMLCTNHEPLVRGTDYAIWRRLKKIPFSVKITDAEADTDMPAKLLGELPGILAWCMRGCLDWQEVGLKPPAEVTDATEEYRKNEDVLGGFLEEHCLISSSLSAKSGQLYERYRKWAESSGENPVNQTRFGKAMTERGFDRVKDSCIIYKGLGLRSE